MKFKDTYVKTEQFSCAVCGLVTGPSEELDADDAGIPYPPAGWVRLTIEQEIPNPDYQAEEERREQKVALHIALAEEQSGKKMSKAEKETAAEVLGMQEGPIDADPYVLHTSVVTLCPAHVAELQKIGLEVG